jgi:hypothetical protein
MSTDVVPQTTVQKGVFVAIVVDLKFSLLVYFLHDFMKNFKIDKMKWDTNFVFNNNS